LSSAFDNSFQNSIGSGGVGKCADFSGSRDSDDFGDSGNSSMDGSEHDC
jgi:hypothetical protein